MEDLSSHTKPEYRVPEPNASKLEVVATEPSGPAQQPRRARASNAPDKIFKYLTVTAALSVVAVVVLIVFELVWHSQLAISKFGLGFFSGSNWDPVGGEFGAFPFV